MSQLLGMNAWDLARRIRAREISSREVVQAYLARIGEVNPRVNAVTTVLADQALADTDGPPVAPPIRVSLVTGGSGTDADVANALRQAAELLAEGGYLVEERPAPQSSRASEIYTQIMSRFGRVLEDQPPVETVASAGFAEFWAAYDPIWTGAQGEAAFDPLMEQPRSPARGVSGWTGRRWCRPRSGPARRSRSAPIWIRPGRWTGRRA